MKVLIALCVVIAVLAKDAPIYNYPFSINFDQTIIRDKTQYKGNGKRLYDPINSRERIDRPNGGYDQLCGSVLPGVNTPCQQYIVNAKRWIAYPLKNLCCFCCDSAHGCGIVKPDWLKGAEYKGEEKLGDYMYDKWSQDGFQYNYFWATTESQIPRKLDVNGEALIDYIQHSFENQTIPFPESTFALPSYCNEKSPANCPIQSLCGQIRANKASISVQ